MTTRICGSLIRALALAIRSTRSPRSAASAILLVWSISSTMTLTLRGSFVCVMVSLLLGRRCFNGRRANWRGPVVGPRQLRYFVVSRSEQTGVDLGVDVHVRLDRRVVAVVRRVVVVAVVGGVVGVVAVRRVVVVARVHATGDVATVGFDVGDVAAARVGGRGLDRSDDHPATGTTGRVAAVAATAGQDPAAVATVATDSTATAGVDVAGLDDRSVVVLDDVATTGLLRVVLDVVAVADDHRRVIARVDVAGVGVVVVAVLLHRTIGEDVAVVVAVDHHAAVGGGVRGLVAEGDVTEVQVDTALLDVVAGVRAEHVVVAQGVVVAERVVVAQRVVVAERVIVAQRVVVAERLRREAR